MTPTTNSVLYELSNFASLFEVAVGLNLVFAIWEGLRNQAIERFRRITAELDGALQLSLGKEYKTSRCATKFAEKSNSYLDTIEKLATIAKFVGVTITSLLLILLAYLGYNPKVAFSFWPTTMLVITSTIVSPALLIAGNYYVRRSKHKLEEYQQQQTNAFSDMKELTSGTPS